MQFCHINSHINYHLINKLFRDKLLGLMFMIFVSLGQIIASWFSVCSTFLLLIAFHSWGENWVTKYKGHNQQKISPINPKILSLSLCNQKDRIALCSTITIQVHDRDDSTKGREGQSQTKAKNFECNAFACSLTQAPTKVPFVVGRGACFKKRK